MKRSAAWLLLLIGLRVHCVDCIALAHAGATGCDGCTWSTLPDTVLLGEALELTVSRALNGQPAQLPTLPLTALDAHFEVFERVTGASGLFEDMRLVLYPRRAGSVPVALPGSPPQMVEVRQDGPVGVRFEWQVEPAQWSVRRSVRLTLEACSRGALRWQRPEVSFVTGLSLIPLQSQPGDPTPDPSGCIPQRWSWSATPTLGGRLRLDLGMLEARRHGTLLRFPSPVFETEIAPVPGWLPAGIALDAPRIVEERRPSTAHAGEPVIWQVRIEADYSEATLAALLQAQTAGTPEWSRYPAQITAVRDAGSAALWDIRLSGHAQAAGSLALPPLSLPWFDVATGTLKQVRVEPGRITVDDPLRDRLLRLGGLGAAVLGLALVLASFRQRLRQRIAHRRLLGRVARASDAAELQAVLASSSGGHQSRAQWINDVLNSRHAPDLPGQLARLDALRFGPNPDPAGFVQLRQEIVQSLRAARDMRLLPDRAPAVLRRAG